LRVVSIISPRNKYVGAPTASEIDVGVGTKLLLVGTPPWWVGLAKKKEMVCFFPFFHQVKLNAVPPAKQKPNTVSLQQKQTEGCAPTQQQQTGPGSLAQPKPDRIPLPSFNKHTPNQQKQTEGRFLFQQKQTKTNKTN